MDLIIDNSLIFGIAGIVLLLLLIVWAIAKRYRIPNANEALVITGSGTEGGVDISIGKGKFIIPFVQKCDTLGLDSREIQIQVNAVSSDNITVIVDATALSKVDGTLEGVKAAAQRFLNKPDMEFDNIVRNILGGNLRGVLGNMSIEQMLRDREALATKVKEAAAEALTESGLRVDTLQINSIETDPGDYIRNLGRPRVAEVQKTAKVAEAEATKAASKAEAEARIVAAEAQRDSELKIAEFRKETEKATAEANAVGPRTSAEQNVLIVKAEQSAAAERAILRQKELAAEVNAVADADLYRAQKAADAALYTAQKNAEAEAARVKKAAEANKDRLEAEGLGEANATRARGLAEGEAIRAKGEAEAQVKELLAAAYEKYGQQAVIDRVLAALPEIFAAAAKPLGEIDNITVVGSADGASGVQQLVTDLTTSVPATVKATTGLDITALIAEYLAGDHGKRTATDTVES
ncbi:MAG: hypothetical protein LBH11_05485 [Propionibacteriaceae bacterium]|jgi:flotillin|nr:hypothetical protein [Propionibacteriaceae bacterium]